MRQNWEAESTAKVEMAWRELASCRLGFEYDRVKTIQRDADERGLWTYVADSDGAQFAYVMRQFGPGNFTFVTTDSNRGHTYTTVDAAFHAIYHGYRELGDCVVCRTREPGDAE